MADRTVASTQEPVAQPVTMILSGPIRSRISGNAVRTNGSFLLDHEVVLVTAQFCQEQPSVCVTLEAIAGFPAVSNPNHLPKLLAHQNRQQVDWLNHPWKSYIGEPLSRPTCISTIIITSTSRFRRFTQRSDIVVADPAQSEIRFWHAPMVAVGRARSTRKWTVIGEYRWPLLGASPPVRKVPTEDDRRLAGENVAESAAKRGREYLHDCSPLGARTGWLAADRSRLALLES